MRTRTNIDALAPSNDTLQREWQTALRRARYAEDALDQIKRIAEVNGDEAVLAVLRDYESKQ